MTDTTSQNELSSTLLEQAFVDTEQKERTLSRYRQSVAEYVRLDQCVAVLSDLQSDRSYIYSGAFGSFFGLGTGDHTIDSAFEECIFSKIHADDLIERNILELRYFQFQKSLPLCERPKYNTFSYLRARNERGEYVYITHRTFYLKSLDNGSIWLALCLYAPAAESPLRKGIGGRIINNETGEATPYERYRQYDNTLLSRRELETLTLIAQGKGSKEIAEKLHIALYTVHRHRQNMIRKMQVANTAEAVKTALLMGLISI